MVSQAMEVDEQEVIKREEQVKSVEDLNLLAFENLRELCSQLERGEHNVVNRVLQSLNRTRKQMNPEILTKLCNTYLSANLAQKDLLLSWLPTSPSSIETPMEVDVKPKAATRATPKEPKPELELYIHLLVLLNLVDNQTVNTNAVECAKNLIQRVDQYDKRVLDNGTIAELPQFLSGRLRLATLRNQCNTQATLIVCILRSYLIMKNFSAAAKFVEKVSFPEAAHNNDVARFYYYQGRIKALQLDYPSAAQFFQLSLRKAPQDSAIGFKQNVQKWVVVVSLLQGEIPDRATFRLPIHRQTLAPYLKLAQAVRFGNIVEFNKVLEECSQAFKSDETLTLIVRLRQNVIKTAIRQISLTYSRIFIKDIAKKLQLPSATEAEYVVEKAIKENTIEGCIVYDKKSKERYMQTTEAHNVYRTTEPQFSFDTRIRNCLELHNVAVKALRYPSDTKNGDIESIEQQREREIMEMEFASEMADEDDDF
uniref:PCI domain-containing protein n=1 Tax=Ditylenchus dipsaci TaxID=166011 RepID=A0A915E3K4_9BILA